MKLLRVIGARPQFMQAAMLRKELDKRGYTEILVHTGQHYDEKMSELFFKQLGIPQPDFNLSVGSGDQGKQTGVMLEKIEQTILDTAPNAVIVDGDTNSTLAGALAAAKLNIPVIHVESGLRSYDRAMPEEVNRIVVDHMSSLLCAPTATAMNNLKKEGLSNRAVLTGDLMLDCYHHFKQQANYKILDDFNLKKGEYCLATIHRASNTNNLQVLKTIITALSKLEKTVFFPCHPRTQKIISEQFVLKGDTYGNIQFSEPVGYLEILGLLAHASLVLTDSGGLQREAYFAKVPSIILRDSTEWLEQVEAGWSALYYDLNQSLNEACTKIENSTKQYKEIYGNGYSAKNIVDAIERMKL